MTQKDHFKAAHEAAERIKEGRYPLDRQDHIDAVIAHLKAALNKGK